MPHKIHYYSHDALVQMCYFNESGTGIIFCDCDEQTYEEYYGKTFTRKEMR